MIVRAFQRGAGFKGALLFMVFFALMAQAPAQGSVPGFEVKPTASQSLGRALVYHTPDQAQSMDARAVLAQLDSIDWQRSQSPTPNLGFTKGPAWFALRLKSSQTARRLLSVSYPPLDYLDVYLFRDGTLVQEVRTGDQRPFGSRPIHHRDFVVPLELPANTESVLLIRAQSSGALQLPIKLWQADDFIDKSQRQFAFQWIFIGVLGALALYNLLIYGPLRDSAYLWYSAYLGAFLLAQISLRGMGFQYLWPQWPEFNNLSLPLAFAASLATAGFFSHKFLGVRDYGRFWSVTLLCIAWSGVIIAALCFVVSYRLVMFLIIVPVSIGGVLLFVCGCYLWWRGQVLARYYVLAWSVFLMGNIVFNLSKAGWLSHNSVTDHMPQVGAVIQALLLSFALAYRVNLERQKRQYAQEQALDAQKKANEQLEGRVEERTLALQEANEQLKHLSEVDGLTQLKNRPYFDQLLQKEWRRHCRQSTHLGLLLLDVDHFKDVNDNLGHLCGDACLRHLAQILKDRLHRAGDIAARYGGEEFVLILPQTPVEGALELAEKIRRDIADSDFVWEGQTLRLTVSIGVASCVPDRQLEPGLLVEQADQALYAAKRAGRNCCKAL